MKKRIPGLIVFVCFVVVMTLGISWFLKVQNGRNDPNWQIAERIYKLESALKEVDKDYKCESISKVTPFSYTDSKGNIITYYCCQTTYIANEAGEYNGLNTDTIDMVVDFTQIKNRRECKVNAYGAFLCENGDLTYLCWMLSPEISCVIAYNADAVAEADIFRMAESIWSPVE